MAYPMDNTNLPLPPGNVSIHRLENPAVCQWKHNDTCMGTILNLGSDYYVTAVRALLRPQDQDVTGKRLLGVVIEAFGYWDLRAAHTSAINRIGDSNRKLAPVAFRYLKSTATYKLCILWFREDDFLLKHSYMFQYNGMVPDYERTMLVDGLMSVEDPFGHGASQTETVDFEELRAALPPTNLTVTPNEWNLELPSKVRAYEKSGKWGNPNGPRTRYGPDLRTIFACT